MRSWLSFLAGNVKELNRQSESFVDEWSLLAETSSTNDILLQSGSWMSSQTWPSNCNRVVGLSLLVQRATHTLLSEDIFFYIPIPQTDNFQYLVTWFESRLKGLLQDLPISVDFLLKFYGNFKPSLIHVTKDWQIYPANV